MCVEIPSGSTNGFGRTRHASFRTVRPSGSVGIATSEILGPLADGDGKIEIQIRDLDQTVIGNPAHGLVRLALSLAIAARGSDLPGVTVVKMMEQMIDGYEQALRTPRVKAKTQGDGLEPIRAVLDQTFRPSSDLDCVALQYGLLLLGE